MKDQEPPKTAENEVLRRMLNTPPLPHNPKPSSTKKSEKDKKKS